MTFTEEVADRVLELARDMSETRVSEQEGTPSRSTLQRWQRPGYLEGLGVPDDVASEWRLSYREAREGYFRDLLSQAVEISDDPDVCVKRAKLRVDARIRVAQVSLPRRHDVTSDGEALPPVQVVLPDNGRRTK